MNLEARLKFQILYPAKLIVNGKLVRDEFPDLGEVLHRSRTTEFAHIDQHCRVFLFTDNNRQQPTTTVNNQQQTVNNRQQTDNNRQQPTTN